jgi:hypothetical protein
MARNLTPLQVHIAHLKELAELQEHEDSIVAARRHALIGYDRQLFEIQQKRDQIHARQLGA